MQQGGIPPLPTIYEEVDWIQNVENGNPMTIAHNNPYILDFHFEVPTGTRNNKIIVQSGFNDTRFFYYNGAVRSNNSGGSAWGIQLNEINHGIIGGQDWTINGVTKYGGIFSRDYINFGSQYHPAYNDIFKYWGRIYIYNIDSRMTNLLVPCYRKSDNAVGLCDLIDNFSFHIGVGWQYG